MFVCSNKWDLFVCYIVPVDCQWLAFPHSCWYFLCWIWYKLDLLILLGRNLRTYRNSFVIMWVYLPQVLPFLVAVVLSLVTRYWYTCTDFWNHTYVKHLTMRVYIYCVQNIWLSVHVHHRLDFTCINIGSDVGNAWLSITSITDIYLCNSVTVKTLDLLPKHIFLIMVFLYIIIKWIFGFYLNLY
jgi:hypothetical protein